MLANGYILNNYLPQQYLWDGTCGYHAINNTLNVINSLNKYYIILQNQQINFNSFINSNIFSEIDDTEVNESIRNYYIYLNDGLKRTHLNDLYNLNEKIDKGNKLYFWNLYNDKVKIKSLINNNIPGIFGIIIFHKEWWVKHWYGIVIDINNGQKNIYIVDNFSIIWTDTLFLKQILNELDLDVKWNGKFNKIMIYSYKLYQVILFVFIYFVFIYGILLCIQKYKIKDIIAKSIQS